MSAAGVRVAAPAARPNGWWGTALFLAAEATLFGTMIGSYFFLRFNTRPWPPPGTPEPRVVAPVVLTIALLLAGVVVYLSLRAARGGRRSFALAALATATCMQAAYLVIQIALMKTDVDRTPPKTSSYASIYYTLQGASHAHVALGLLLDLWLLARLAGSITPYRLVGLSATNLYWQVVNALTVAVLLTLLSPRL
jgi:heme/copper-type cytochrome/quinol oxidase subunit 3